MLLLSIVKIHRANVLIIFKRWINIPITMSTNLKLISDSNIIDTCKEIDTIKREELTVCAKMRLSFGVHRSIWASFFELRLKTIADATAIITKIINATYQKFMKSRSIGFLNLIFSEIFVHIVVWPTKFFENVLQFEFFFLRQPRVKCVYFSRILFVLFAIFSLEVILYLCNLTVQIQSKFWRRFNVLY